MKRKRSIVSRKPRANCDAIFKRYFGWIPHAENESVRDTVVVSDGLGTNNKLKKLKLKFGGVTHTIHTKSKAGTCLPSGSDGRNPKVMNASLCLSCELFSSRVLITCSVN